MLPEIRSGKERDMSADKHRSLRIRAAYLRAAGAADPETTGFGINVKWARKLTPFLKRMADEGEVVLRRCTPGNGHKGVTRVVATPSGRLRLAEIDARFGTAFGTPADIDVIEPVRETKAMRRRRAMTPMELRMRKERRRAAIMRAQAAQAARFAS